MNGQPTPSLRSADSQEMAAKAKAMSSKPFVPSGHLGHVFTPDAFLSQPSSAEGKQRQQSPSRSASAGAKLPAWRSGGPPKQVSC